MKALNPKFGIASYETVSECAMHLLLVVFTVNPADPLGGLGIGGFAEKLVGQNRNDHLGFLFTVLVLQL